MATEKPNEQPYKRTHTHENTPNKQTKNNTNNQTKQSNQETNHLDEVQLSQNAPASERKLNQRPKTDHPPPPPYNGVSFGGPCAVPALGCTADAASTRLPPQTHLADDPLETSKHCIKEKAARLRGLPFLAYFCSGGAKMTLARGGCQPAVVRGHLASKTAYVCRFSPKKRPYRRVRGFFWAFLGFWGPKNCIRIHTFAPQGAKVRIRLQKKPLEGFWGPRRTYKLAPGTDPPSPFGLQTCTGE